MGNDDGFFYGVVGFMFGLMIGSSDTETVYDVPKQATYYQQAKTPYVHIETENNRSYNLFQDSENERFFVPNSELEQTIEAE